MPKGKQTNNGPKHDIEDYEPGASKEEVLTALQRSARATEEPTPRSKKRRERPSPSWS